MAERQLPKLNVAGSIPVSRSIRISSLHIPASICAPLCSDYITKRRFSSWLTAGSLLSTGDCVYTFWLTSRLCPS